MFRTNYVDSACLRCGKTVYPTDKVGPLKDYTFFHSGCFRCIECQSKLTLKTYFNNQHAQHDKEVYCSTHVPKIGPGHFDGESMGIKSAMNAPKSTPFINEQIRPGGKATFDADALAIRSQMKQPEHKTSVSNGGGGGGGTGVGPDDNVNNLQRQWGRFDTSALHIQVRILDRTRCGIICHKPHVFIAARIESHRSTEEVFQAAGKGDRGLSRTYAGGGRAALF
jgi:hypothetical protein